MHSCQVSFGLVAGDCWSVVVFLATKLRNEAFWLHRYVGSSENLVQWVIVLGIDCRILTYLVCIHVR